MEELEFIEELKKLIEQKKDLDKEIEQIEADERRLSGATLEEGSLEKEINERRKQQVSEKEKQLKSDMYQKIAILKNQINNEILEKKEQLKEYQDKYHKKIEEDLELDDRAAQWEAFYNGELEFRDKNFDRQVSEQALKNIEQRQNEMVKEIQDLMLVRDSIVLDYDTQDIEKKQLEKLTKYIEGREKELKAQSKPERKEPPTSGKQLEGKEPPTSGKQPEGKEPPTSGKQPEGKEPPTSGKQPEGKEPPTSGKQPEGKEPPTSGKQPEGKEPPTSGKRPEGKEPSTSATNDSVRVLYSAKQDKYLVRNVNTEEEWYISRKDLRFDKERLAEKAGKTMEDLKNVDINVLEVLRKYDRQFGTNKANEYYKMMIEIGKSPKDRENEMEESQIDIEYNLKGLFDKNKKSKQPKIDVADRTELLSIANNAKKKGIATVKKGFKVSAFEMRDNIVRKIKAIPLPGSKKVERLSAGKEKHKTNSLDDRVNADYWKSIDPKDYKKALRSSQRGERMEQYKQKVDYTEAMRRADEAAKAKVKDSESAREEK